MPLQQIVLTFDALPDWDLVLRAHAEEQYFGFVRHDDPTQELRKSQGTTLALLLDVNDLARLHVLLSTPPLEWETLRPSVRRLQTAEHLTPAVQVVQEGGRPDDTTVPHTWWLADRHGHPLTAPTPWTTVPAFLATLDAAQRATALCVRVFQRRRAG